MDLISKAIDEIKFTVPRAVLDLAYVGKRDYRSAPLSLEDMIRKKTIQARVLVDANIVGGETIVVDLEGLTPKKFDEFNYIYQIPGERVNFRTILSALSVNYLTYNATQNTWVPGMSASTPNYINDVSSAAARAMASRSNIPIVSNSEVVMAGHNTVMIRNHLLSATVVQLRCVVCNDEDLNNLSIRNAPAFSRLCSLAVKSFIYNELRVTVDKGYLHYGQELPAIKEIVDSYADSEQMYQDFLKEEWQVVSKIDNRLFHEDFIKLQINPGL